MALLQVWHGAGGLPLTGGKAQKGLYGKAKRASFASACFSGGACFTGAADGAIYRWVGRQVASVLEGAHTGGPCFSLRALPPSLGERCGIDGVEVFASGGADGLVRFWACSGGGKPSELSGVEAVQACPRPNHDREPCGVVALAFGEAEGSKGGVRLVCGTKQGTVVQATVQLAGAEVGATATMETLTSSHCSGEAWGLSAHPFELKFATAGDDNTIRIFDIEARRELCKRVINPEAGPDRESGHGASTMSK